MPDEAPPRRPATPEPASDAKKHAKRVVLSSVAKVAPANDAESLLGEPEPGKGGPPELPPKTSDSGLIRPVGWTTRPGGTTTIIKLPPKTGTLPRLTSLSQQAKEEAPTSPPDMPANGDDEAKRPQPIKLNTPPAVPAEPDSIFATPTTQPVESKAPPIESKPTAIEAKAPPVEKAAPIKLKPAPVETKAPVIETKRTPIPSKVAPPPLPPPALKAAPAPPRSPAPVIPKKPEQHHVAHVPPLVHHDAAAPELANESLLAPPPTAPKNDPLAQTVKLSPTPSAAAPPAAAPAAPPTQTQLPLVAAPGRTIPDSPRITEAKAAEPVVKHRLPPRSSATGRLRTPAQPAPPAPAEKPVAPVTPPKVFPPAAAAAVAAATPPPPLAAKAQPVKSSITPPTIPLHPGSVKPPTIPLRPAPARAPISPLLGDKKGAPQKGEEPVAPSVRMARKRRQKVIGIVVFYVLLVAILPALYFTALYFTRETRVEGQVIPPPGMVLTNEVWIVTDFRDLAAGIADDLASDRQIVLQDMQEKLGHVQRAQADVATREARIRLLKDQIQADNDEELSLMKQARDASQQIWNGPGAQLEVDYQSRLTSLYQAIAERAKANHLQYNPDPNFYSPEVWSNAYRLALYQVPPGVDSLKERAWIDAEMKSWHDFTKAQDQKQTALRQQATQLKLAPASKVTDIKSQVDDLQQRIDATIAEEEPLKAELEQARADLVAVQTKEAGLDAKPYEKLDALPEQNVTKRLPLLSNGRFSWRELEKEEKYAADEKAHVFWIFARAIRPDGRQYWALDRFSVAKDSTTLLMIEPGSFQSTKAILRPDLSPDEQAQ